jgi:hypothetical protein
MAKPTSKATKAAPSAFTDLKTEIKVTIERAELFEARARIALAQAEIAKANLIRKKEQAAFKDLDK